jgi:hypothetical protein
VKKIRCGRGLGDSLYLQAVARHLVKRGEKLQVRSDWPDVFRTLDVEVAPFTRAGVDIVAHYSLRKGIKGTTQFEDCCIQAGIREPVDLRLDWEPANVGLVDQLRSHGKPILCVQLPRNPMARMDGFGRELLPDCRVIQRFIDAARDHLVVQVGSGEALYRFHGIDVDLANKTTVSDLIDIGCVADRFLGYTSFMVPLAESFDKPAMFVWSRRGLKSGTQYVRQITPEKSLHKATSRYVVDDEAIDAFL